MLKIHNCARCAHEWASRAADKPDRCAKCKAKYWWRSARVPRSSTGEPGPKRKYPINNLEVGAELLLPWHRSENLSTDEKANRSMNQSIDGYAKRTGRKFHKQPTAGGLFVTRIF